jgi:hypothetical protein
MKSIKQELDAMLKRSLTLCGYTYAKDEATGQEVVVPKDKAVRDFLTTLASINPDPRAQADMIIAAWDDTTGLLQKALNSVRTEAVGNFIAAESVFKSAFFETVTLRPDEEPWYTNETGQEARISEMGEDGSPEQVRIVKPQQKAAVGLHTVATDYIRYKTMDIMKGDISAATLRTLNIARDLTFKLDTLHRDLLTASLANGGAFGLFSYENDGGLRKQGPASANKATKIYLAHSGIVTSHLPTTNDIVNGTTGGPTGTRFTVQYYDPVYAEDGTTPSDYTGFRPAVLRAIIDYASSWGKYLPDGGGMLQPTGEIIVPSSDIINIGAGLLPSNNDTANSVQQQVQDNGYFSLNLLNKNWKFIPDVTIAAGTCYPRFNLLPGISYEKPSWDLEDVKTNRMENWEERAQRRAWGAVIIAQRRVRAMQITYIAA